MTHAVIFPGQGSQRRGMGRDLFDKYEDLVRQADDVLGYSIRELCLDDPDRKLSQTQYTQPALFTVNALCWEEAKAGGAVQPRCFAGHSLGEYNALAAAGAFDFITGLRLVQKRGELMAGARNGAMAAIIGPDEDHVRSVLARSETEGVWVANLNTPSQTVVSGSRTGIEAAKSLFEELPGTRYLLLNVSGPFHSPLMEPAAREFESFASEFEFKAPETPVVSNVLAEPYAGGGIRNLLSRQINHPVRWMASVRHMADNGIDAFIETGPGRVLTHMVNDILEPADP